MTKSCYYYYTSILFKSCADPQPLLLLVRMRQSLLETVKPTQGRGRRKERERERKTDGFIINYRKIQPKGGV